MIRETLDPSSPHAMVIVTPSEGISFQRRLTPSGDGEAATISGIHTPYWGRLTRQGNTSMTEHSPDGSAWSGFNSGGSSVTIPMSTGSHSGLTLTSHNPNAFTAATFSGVAATGNGRGALADLRG